MAAHSEPFRTRAASNAFTRSTLQAQTSWQTKRNISKYSQATCRARIYVKKLKEQTVLRLESGHPDAFDVSSGRNLEVGLAPPATLAVYGSAAPEPSSALRAGIEAGEAAGAVATGGKEANPLTCLLALGVTCSEEVARAALRESANDINAACGMIADGQFDHLCAKRRARTQAGPPSSTAGAVPPPKAES